MDFEIKKLWNIILIGVLIIFTAVIFISVLGQKEKLYISGAVVPHHNFVAEVRAKFFLELASYIKKPKTIILLSPNHYHAGYGKIQTTSKDFLLGYGEIKVNQEVVSYLLEQGVVSDEPASFEDEHGIYNILKDIHDNFPGSNIVPIIFENPSKEELARLESVLKEICANCFMISSVDFSHDQEPSVAQAHDGISISYMQSRDVYNLLNDNYVDSGPALALLAMWAMDSKTAYFHLNQRTSSGDTTHVFGWYGNINKN